MISPRLNPIPPDQDVLVGAKAIASFLGVKPSQVYRWHNDRHVPTFAIGTNVCARRSTLVAWIEGQEATARKAGTTTP